MAKPYKVIDLFAGAGGLALGFKQAGFVPILAIESEEDFADTYRENIGGHILVGDIVEFVEAGIDTKADVVVGGPPCQGFSNLTGNRENDERRALSLYFMDVVEMTECKAFLIENVPNLLTSWEGQEIIERAEAMDFHVDKGVLNAAKFGVPQNRKRAFIVGSRLGPIKLSAPNGEQTSVREAFKGVPRKRTHEEPKHRPLQGKELHIGRNPTPMSLERYALIPPGGNRFDLQKAAPHLTPECWIRKTSGGTDLFGRLEWDGPARCTIRTEFYKPEKGRYLHPSAPRPITHWEAARLQSFPDSFKWHGTKIRIAIQIGNAVPPGLARVLAGGVMRHLDAHKARPVRKPRLSEVRQLQFA